jgi:hypothetical protein
MSDFEVHAIGHYEELRLSRELAKAIEKELTSFGKVMPQSVLVAYDALKKHYAWQIENGIQ